MMVVRGTGIGEKLRLSEASFPRRGVQDVLGVGRWTRCALELAAHPT